jgi:hypothetical protein
MSRNNPSCRVQRQSSCKLSYHLSVASHSFRCRGVSQGQCEKGEQWGLPEGPSIYALLDASLRDRCQPVARFPWAHFLRRQVFAEVEIQSDCDERIDLPDHTRYSASLSLSTSPGIVANFELRASYHGVNDTFISYHRSCSKRIERDGLFLKPVRQQVHATRKLQLLDGTFCRHPISSFSQQFRPLRRPIRCRVRQFTVP